MDPTSATQPMKMIVVISIISELNHRLSNLISNKKETVHLFGFLWRVLPYLAIMRDEDNKHKTTYCIMDRNTESLLYGNKWSTLLCDEWKQNLTEMTENEIGTIMKSGKLLFNMRRSSDHVVQVKSSYLQHLFISQKSIGLIIYLFPIEVDLIG